MKGRAFSTEHCSKISVAKTLHGQSYSGKRQASRTYRSWQAMWQRCTNPKHVAWKNYGGRGIQICWQWREFGAFLDDMGERPQGKSLDRIDGNGNYEPGNCRWATSSEQNRNHRPS